MKIHPEIVHLNGVVSVVLKPQFLGDPTDADDRARIAAYGDPKVNMGGQFAGTGDPAPIYTTGAPEVWVALTTEMPSKVVRFMTRLPDAVLGQPAPAQGPLDVITTDPVAAATVYVAAIQARIASAVGALRLKSPAKLVSLPDTTV